MICGIYAIRNLNNGKVYVGSSRDCARRFSEHRSRLVRGAHINAKLQSAWKKHGASAFEFTVLASVICADDLAGVEQIIIDDVNAVRYGYNLSPTAGNTSGWKASAETRQRMSEAAKRRDNSAQVLAMANATRGKKRPQHVLDALLASHLGSRASAETRAKQSASARARSRYSQEDRKAMYEMRLAGATWRSIGKAFGVGHGPVMVYVKDWIYSQPRLVA